MEYMCFKETIIDVYYRIIKGRYNKSNNEVNFVVPFYQRCTVYILFVFNILKLIMIYIKLKI